MYFNYRPRTKVLFSLVCVILFTERGKGLVSALHLQVWLEVDITLPTSHTTLPPFRLLRRTKHREQEERPVRKKAPFPPDQDQSRIINMRNRDGGRESVYLVMLMRGLSCIAIRSVKFTEIRAILHWKSESSPGIPCYTM